MKALTAQLAITALIARKPKVARRFDMGGSSIAGRFVSCFSNAAAIKIGKSAGQIVAR
jgi:hypothetical protein